MLVLIITVLATVNVNAVSYTAKDTVINSNIHDYFNNYFNDNLSYQYFAYECGERTCYYGIDSENNYVNISYTSTSSGYNYDYLITSGIDEDFSVTGTSIFKHEVSNDRILLIVIVSVVTFGVFWLLNRGVESD